MRFLSLQGNPYEIGYQHGEKLKDLIHRAIDDISQSAANQDLLMKRAERLGNKFPNLIEELKGIAEGSACPFEAILLYNLRPISTGCSNIFFLNDDGPMLGHVNDDIGDSSFDVAFHIKFDNGQEILNVGIAGNIGTGAALNRDGLAISHSCARSDGSTNAKAFLNLPLLRRALIDNCRDCHEARSFLLDYSFFSGADNIIVVDSKKLALVAEKLSNAVEFREPNAKGLFCTGRQLTPKIREMVKQDDYEMNASDTSTLINRLMNRELYFKKAIEANNNDLSLDLMKSVLRCTEQGIEICNNYSNWAAILLPGTFEMLIADRLPCDKEFKSPEYYL